jgi:chromosome segregation ATPase
LLERLGHSVFLSVGNQIRVCTQKVMMSRPVEVPRSNVPASPALSDFMDALRNQFAQVLIEIQGLQAQEDRVRHELGREARRRDELRARASNSSTSQVAESRSVQVQLSSEITEAEQKIAELREELAEVRGRLTSAEQERDRLKKEVDDFEEMHASVSDMMHLHFERAEYERRRYESSQQEVKALQGQIRELEAVIAERDRELDARRRAAGPVE